MLEREVLRWWKSFTTGKSAEMLGGIPHDQCTSCQFQSSVLTITDGMTSLSVRQYIVGVLKAHGPEREGRGLRYVECNRVAN